MQNAQNQRSSFQSQHRPLSYRFFNTLGSGLNAVGLSAIDLEADSLLESAKKATQLGDFGELDFQVPLACLVESLKSEAQLNFVGKHLSRKMVLELLSERLRTQHYIEKNPETLSETIDRPLFVMGMPRSGTSFLFNLLCQDPNSSWIRYWELRMPPQPLFQGEPADQAAAERALIENCSQDLENTKRMMPQLERIHAIDALGPYECFRLLERNFVSHTFGLYANVPTYIQWIESECLEADTQTQMSLYRYYHQQIQVIKNLRKRSAGNQADSAIAAKHWVFKSPVHLWSMNYIASALPDACFIHIHRDPLSVIPSTCSFIASGRGVLSDHVDFQTIGKTVLKRWSKAINQALEVRQKDAALKVVDIHYQQLIKAPVETVRMLYQRLGYDFTPDVESSLKKYVSESRKSGRGQRNQYSLQQFGLKEAEIYEAFHTYYEFLDSL